METLAKAIANTIVRRGIRPASKYDRCMYGAQALLSSLLTTVVMLAVAIVLGLVPEFLVYTAVYWTIHSIADAYHCNRYYKCLLMSLGFFIVMALFCLFTSATTRRAISWMLLLLSVGVFLFQYLDRQTRSTFSKKQLLVYGVVAAAGITLSMTPLVTAAFPYAYGMYVITLLQSKVRCKE